MQVIIDADLRFEVGDGAGPAPEVSGTVRSTGSAIEVTVTDPALLLGSTSRRGGRAVAKAIADRGLVVSVHGPDGEIVSVGAVRAPLLQRLVTRSRHVRVAGLGGARTILAAQRSSRPARQLGLLTPPPTPFPLMPTARGRRGPTTTHDPRGGGDPRLVFARSEHPMPGDVQRVHPLVRGTTVIGGGPDADLQVEGLPDQYAEIRRTDADEYVLVAMFDGELRAVTLRTGARIPLGSTHATYLRAEYADHGRPYGGRQGGELGRDVPQPIPRQRGTSGVARPRTNRDPGEYR